MDTGKSGRILLLLSAFGVLVASSGGGSLGSPLGGMAYAQTLGTPMVCSQTTLHGSYGLWEEGTIFAELPGFPPPPLPTVDTVVITFDGAGQLSGKVSANDGGMPVTATFDGTYTVNADCTFSAQYIPSIFPITSHVTGTIAGQGMKQQLNYIYTDPYIVSWGSGKKTPPGGCSLASLKGAYADSSHGTILAGFGAPPAFPVAGSGILTFDGKGNLFGNEQGSFGGMVNPMIGNGTYTVNPDCTYTNVYTETASGLITHDAGIIVGQGQFQELHFIFADPGVVLAGTAKRQ